MLSRSGSNREQDVRGSKLIRNRIAIPPPVGAGDPVAGSRIDQYGGGASVHAEGADAGNVVSARLQIAVDGVRNIGLKVEAVEPRIVRPERAVEMQRLDPRPFECLVQVRVPGGPELHDVEKCLQDGLVLVVAAGRTDRHEGLAVAKHDARRQRIPWSRPRAQLGGAGLVEPELL